MGLENAADDARILFRSRISDPSFVFSLFTESPDSNYRPDGESDLSPEIVEVATFGFSYGSEKQVPQCSFLLETENGKQERHLVARVGNFSVIWNFQQVDGSHECYQNQVGLKSCYCYEIVPKDDSIVDSGFMHDKFAVTDSPEAPLVVATPLKVSSFSITSRRLQL